MTEDKAMQIVIEKNSAHMMYAAGGDAGELTHEALLDFFGTGTVVITDMHVSKLIDLAETTRKENSENHTCSDGHVKKTDNSIHDRLKTAQDILVSRGVRDFKFSLREGADFDQILLEVTEALEAVISGKGVTNITPKANSIQVVRDALDSCIYTDCRGYEKSFDEDQIELAKTALPNLIDRAEAIEKLEQSKLECPVLYGDGFIVHVTAEELLTLNKGYDAAIETLKGMK